MEHRVGSDPNGSTPRRRSRQRKRDEIVEILEELRASGLSQRVFCEGRGLSVSTLGSWVKKFRDKPSQITQRDLIPVRITASRTTKVLPIEVVLANGRIVRVLGGFDPDVLSKLMSVAESPC